MADDSFEIVFRAGGISRQYWHDLWRHRELLYFLTWRDVLVRYKQTALGIAWSAIRPLATTFAFTIIFSLIAKLPSGNVPYPILVFSAMLPWQFFADAFVRSSSSLIGNAHLISKVYFPRLIVPISAVAVSLVDFVVSFGLLLVLMFAYGYLPGWPMATLPFFLVIAVLASTGLGLWMASLSVKYRDLLQIVPFILQFGMFMSPVGFSSSVVPAKWRLLYDLNPMVGVIDGFRWAISGRVTPFDSRCFVLSTTLALALFISGIWYFRRTERTVADVI